MANVTASMQTFLREQGVAEEVVALFTAEVILTNAFEEMESRGLAALQPTTADQATRQASGSSSPAPTTEMDGQGEGGETSPSQEEDSGSESGSPEPEPEPPTFPLVENSPLARLTAAPKSVSRVRNPKYSTFKQEESATFDWLSFRLASAMVALHKVTRTGDALAIGQFAVDFLGRENLFTSLEFYMGTEHKGGIFETSDAVKKPLREVYDVLRTQYCREQASKFQRALRKCNLVLDVKAERARDKGKIGKRVRGSVAGKVRKGKGEE